MLLYLEYNKLRMLKLIVASLLVSIALGVELKYALTFEKRAIEIANEVNKLGVGWNV